MWAPTVTNDGEHRGKTLTFLLASVFSFLKGPNTTYLSRLLYGDIT